MLLNFRDDDTEKTVGKLSWLALAFRFLFRILLRVNRSFRSNYYDLPLSPPVRTEQKKDSQGPNLVEGVITIHELL
jgi:hypothetical protein